MTVKIRDIAYLGLIVVIFMTENFFYLVKDYDRVKDVGIVFAFLWSIWVVWYYKDVKVKYRFKYFILLGIILTITSSIQSSLLYGQAFILGIRPQRIFLVSLIVYFPIRKLLAGGIVTYKRFEQLIYKIGILELILYIGQYFAGSSFQFLYAGTNNVYSTTRYYMNTVFLVFFLFICLNNLFFRQRILMNLILIVSIMFEILVVGKMRMTFLAVSATIVIGTILWRKGGSLKVFCIIIIIVAALFASQFEVVQSILPTIRGDASSAVNTLNGRAVSRAFYMTILKEHPILGGGYINTQWAPAYEAARLSDGIYWVDNGVLGFLYFYGGLGAIWLIFFLAKWYKYALFYLKKQESYFFFLLPLSWIIASPTEAHWYFSSFLVVILLICILECHIDKKRIVQQIKNTKVSNT